jgi:hypothetical protein
VLYEVSKKVRELNLTNVNKVTGKSVVILVTKVTTITKETIETLTNCQSEQQRQKAVVHVSRSLCKVSVLSEISQNIC